MSRIFSISILAFLSLIYGQANFVTVGDDGVSANSIAYSYDGIVWISVTDRIFSVKGNGVTYGDKWIAAGQGSNTLAYSYNGINWFPASNTILTITAKCVAYSPFQRQYIAGGQGTNTLTRSPNGTTWIPVTSPFTTTVNGLGYSDSLNRWVAVGSGGNTISYSNNGISWIGIGNIFFIYGTSVTFANGLFVATGGGNSYTQINSASGISWGASLSTFANSSNSVAYGQGKWLLTCTPLSVVRPFASSTAGQTWTPQAVQPIQLNAGRGIIYNLAFNRWIAVGQGTSTTSYSSNGISWTYGTNIFNISAFGVASLPNNQITTTVVNLVTNSTTIPVGYNIDIAGNLTVIGDLTVSGNWIINSQSNVAVQGALNIEGNTTFNTTNFPNETNIVTSGLNITNGASLTIVLNADPGLGNTIVLQIVKYSTPIVGTFTINQIETTYMQNSNECLTATPVYSATVLSVAISSNQCNSNPGINANTRTGMSTEIIIGISVGCIVVGTIIILLLIYLMKIRIKSWEKIQNVKIRENSINSMKPSPGVNL